ncbi:type II toxin-antitoxin system RelE/ParE family toxin [Streptomyces sp. NPDC093225]|uniref:type II toxin-antitoxin system RelE family toxin n=1 Tax=Streptomyces sp. NPDC093225 TaxID=3366034 RepID=UPI003806B108
MTTSAPGSAWSARDLHDRLGRGRHQHGGPLLKDDPDGLRQLMDAVDLLANQPRPEGTTPYGSPDLRRMHVGRYRVLYEITEATVTIMVIHVDRLG